MPRIKKVSYVVVEEMLRAGDTLVVDVREEEEYIIEHVKGAILLPLDSITEESALEVLPDKHKRVVVYCKSGRRSALGAEKLALLGYDVYDVGSIVGSPFGYEQGL